MQKKVQEESPGVDASKLVDQVGSVHRVISLTDLAIEDKKLSQFAKYLSH